MAASPRNDLAAAGTTPLGAGAPRTNPPEGQGVRQLQAQPAFPAGTEGEIEFISGLGPAGAIIATSYQTWNAGANPASYSSFSHASKWGGTTAGTPGGVVTYYFDPHSNWTAQEQQAFISGLDLWSAIANLQFAATTTLSAADVILERGTDGTAGETSGKSHIVAVGGTALPNQGLNSTISIDTSVPGWEELGVFGYSGGYAVDTVVHEEGHLLGLGHAGAYNSHVQPATQQFSVFDTRLYSIMSYIEPEDPSAAFFGDYPVTGTQWDGNDPTTWMPLDIAAAQRLYGTPTSTPLSGGQTFGFHCNVVGDIEPYFDFTINASPVVTLWDMGKGNTLDLSGFNAAATINLSPGSFTNCDGMVNNIIIAPGTIINTAIGGGGGDTFLPNNFDDVIDGRGGANTVDYSAVTSPLSITLANAAATVFVNGAAKDTISNIQNLTGGSGSDFLTGDSGRNILDGGAGDDFLDGGLGVDSVYGGEGDDSLEIFDPTEVAAGETYDGGDGTDELDIYTTQAVNLSSVNVVNIESLFSEGAVSLGADQLGEFFHVSTAGAITLTTTGKVYLADDQISTTEFHLNQHGNTLNLTGDTANYTVIGGAADDVILGGIGADELNGNSGNDMLNGGAGDDVLNGGPGDDILKGGPGADTMSGGVGDDTYYVDNTGDRVIEAATAGVDTVFSSISYTLPANVEKLTLTGTAKINATGNSLGNVIVGNAAANSLDGKGGDDTLTGGGGADTFVFDTALGKTKNVDTITDFDPAADHIKLSQADFAALGASGHLSTKDFIVGPAALTSSQHIIYNASTGALFYDSDGSGAAAAVKFAQLGVNLAAQASDFILAA